MRNYTWEHCHIGDVMDNGPGYAYSLALDYEKYVHDFGFIPIRKFIKEWKCITRETFSRLIPGDYVYTSLGERYVITEEPYESDDEQYVYIDAVKESDINPLTRSAIFQSGISIQKMLFMNIIVGKK